MFICKMYFCHINTCASENLTAKGHEVIVISLLYTSMGEYIIVLTLKILLWFRLAMPQDVKRLIVYT